MQHACGLRLVSCIFYRSSAVSLLLDPSHATPQPLKHERPPTRLLVLTTSNEADTGGVVPVAAPSRWHVPVEDITVAPVTCRASTARRQTRLVRELSLRAFPVLGCLGQTESVQQFLFCCERTASERNIN